MAKYILRPKEDKTTTFSIRVDNELLAQYDELSRCTHRSRNELINRAMRFFIENVQVETSNSSESTGYTE